MSSPNIDQLTEIYVTIRDERRRIAEEFDKADKALKADLSEIEAMLLSVCNDIGAESIKTQHGTVMRRINERFYTTDWNSFKEFVAEHQAFDLFEKRIHQGNFKQFLEEHKGDGLPPGVNVMREYAITVRKSSTEE